jgi:hypothetical protein
MVLVVSLAAELVCKQNLVVKVERRLADDMEPVKLMAYTIVMVLHDDDDDDDDEVVVDGELALVALVDNELVD